MAVCIQFQPESDSFVEYMERVFQSSNVNIILGAGASNPAIIVVGSIEADLQGLYDQGLYDDACLMEYDFIKKVQEPSNCLINGFFSPIPQPLTSEQTQQAFPKVEQTAQEVFVPIVQPQAQKIIPPPSLCQTVKSVLSEYEILIENLETMLLKRKTQLLPKKVNVFTTNYDLFIEKAALKRKGLILNDGFQNRSSLTGKTEFDTRSFSRVFYESSEVYDYKVELPVINLIKMHGSLSWGSDSADELQEHKIVYNVETKVLHDDVKLDVKKKIVSSYNLIFPRKEKFKTVLLNHTYYDLMRLYSNELDKEQTTLIAFGFSFADEHILDLTKRALRNSTLKLMIFAFDSGVAMKLLATFSPYNNVDVIVPETNQEIRFKQFNEALSCYL
jgi:hypothetical protein